MKLITSTGKRRPWTPLEERLAASIVYRVLKNAAAPMTLDEVVRASGELTGEEVRHSIMWLRGKKVDVRIEHHGPLILGVEREPSTIRLVEP